MGGVLVDDDGRVVATWSSFAYQSGGEGGQVNRGISANVLAEFIDVVRSGRPIYSLEVELGYAPRFSLREGMVASVRWCLENGQYV